MDVGGVQTWLMHALRRADGRELQLDFLVHSTDPGFYDREIERRGGRVIPCPTPSRPTRYRRRFLDIVKRSGPYDVVHSHVHHFSGFVLRLARAAGIPLRIAHSHSAAPEAPPARAPLRHLYLRLSKAWIRRHATAGLAASRAAARALYGPAWENDSRWRVLYCGIDLAPFRVPVDRGAVRADMGLPDDAWVLGHVGRLVAQKNPLFLIELLDELRRGEPRARLLLIGDGPLRPALELRAAELGLSGDVVLAGTRTDVARLLRGAVDVFVFPSLDEGLGLALVEAQAAGLPCVYSDAVPDDVAVAPQLLRRLSLRLPPARWADEVVRASRGGAAADDALVRVERSPFELGRSLDELFRVYSASASRTRSV